MQIQYDFTFGGTLVSKIFNFWTRNFGDRSIFATDMTIFGHNFQIVVKLCDICDM